LKSLGDKINFEDLSSFGKRWKNIEDFSTSLSISVQLKIQLAKNDDLKIIEKTHKIEKKHYQRNADVPFVDSVKDGKIIDQISKDIFGKKLFFPNADEREQIAEAYFKIKYKDINEKLKNYIIEHFKVFLILKFY
jgi:predicted Zn-dependent protease